MYQTAFWDPSAKSMTATEFLKRQFGALPDFSNGDDGFRAIWSLPDTRKGLLASVAVKGFGTEALTEMQRVITAENCDI